MPDIGFVYDCEEESIQIGHHMNTRFLLSSFRSPKKNKPVMLAHDGFTSPHALPAIDFLLLRSAFCIRKPRKSSCDAAYQKDIIQTQVNQGLTTIWGSFKLHAQYKISAAKEIFKALAKAGTLYELALINNGCRLKKSATVIGATTNI